MAQNMSDRCRVLVLGGYGTFGSRICRALAGAPNIALTVAGRSYERARTLVGELRSGNATSLVEAVHLDTDAPSFEGDLVRRAPHLVIHAAGPFQGQDYRVARACIAARAHYIDLADSRRFVCGIGEINTAAAAAGTAVVSGASSVPALAAAVVDHFKSRFRALYGIFHCIAPGNRSPRGEGAARAVLSYAGRPYRQWADGEWRIAYGWQDVQRVAFANGVGRRWLANCEVPDLELFPARYAGVRTVKFQAGLELTVLHLGLWALSWLRRVGCVSALTPAAPALVAASRWFERFGSDLGVMAVVLNGVGKDDDRPLCMAWQLVAPNGVGPNIPVLASVILARRLAAGWQPEHGARPCLGLVSFDEFSIEFAKLGVRQMIA